MNYMICNIVQGSEVVVGETEYRYDGRSWEMFINGRWIYAEDCICQEVLTALYETKQENKVMRAYVDKHAAYGLESAIECLEKIGVQIPV